MNTILIIILALMLIGAFWPYSRGWGRGRSRARADRRV
jgi:hypothetical protein